MNLRPLKSLRNQTLVILILVLGVSHLISISIYSFDRHNTLVAEDALDVAERAAGIASLFQQIPRQWWGAVARGVDSRTFRVSLSEAPMTQAAGAEEEDLEVVHQYLREHATDPRNILIGRRAPEGSVEFGDAAVESLVQISLGLNGDAWLNVTGSITLAETRWPRPAVLYILSDLLAMVAVGIWMVHRVTSPLTTFASAADRLGKNLRSEPLPENGPEEVATAARAFNEMQNRLQRMIENRTEMLAAISHDLRTPITVLALRAEHMKDTADRDKLLATLEEMETMISSVLDLARETFQEEANRTVDLAAMLQSLCEDMADVGAAIELTAPDQLLYRCRRVALKRAITNLVDNALRYAGNAELVLEDEGSSVLIEVLDNGPGFAHRELDDLFVPFFRAERSRSRDTGGTGLGLSIAKAIVESHGGTLRLGNRDGAGARAAIRLPK